MIARIRSILAADTVQAASHGDDGRSVARPSTRPGEFIASIEGPDCDREGNVYAVNFAKQGAVGG